MKRSVAITMLLFVALAGHADDIAYTGSFHGDEMPYRDGEEFLTFGEGWVLVPVNIAVTAEEDPIVDDAGEKTGKHVAVAGFEDAPLIRGKKLHPGKIAPAQPDFAELIPTARKSTFTLGSRKYELSYRCGETECTLVLEGEGIAQDLVTIPIDRNGREIHTRDVEHNIMFAGDLDHDGRLDLIANLPRHFNEMRPTLWMSGAAKAGQLVAMTAELSTTGC